MSDLSNPRTSTALGRWFRRVRGVLSDLAARHALRQELLECDRSGVLDSVLRSIQLSRNELKPLIENYPLSRRLFVGMAARLKVDPQRGGPIMLRELQHTCAVCTHQRQCQQWLKSGRTEGYDEFCPNADYWHGLKERIRTATACKA